MVWLWICAGSVLQRFLPTRSNSAKRATFSRGKRHNPWKSSRNPWTAALYKTVHLQELRRTQRDKYGTRYAVLISAAAACLLYVYHTLILFARIVLKTAMKFLPMTLQNVDLDLPPLASNLTQRDSDRINLLEQF